MEIFTGARLFDGVRFHDDHALVVEHGKVLAITPHADRPRGVQHDLGGGVLAPGFVDWQVNGGGGALFNEAPTPETDSPSICGGTSRAGPKTSTTCPTSSATKRSSATLTATLFA